MISVFTPSHTGKYLDDCYNSLAKQSVQEWEWVVYINGAYPDPGPDHWAHTDKRVRFIRGKKVPGMGVGYYKKKAVEFCTGDILVELDHDDWLLPHALEEVQKAFDENPEASLVFSDFAYMDANGEPSPFQYQGRWDYTSEQAYGKLYHRCRSQRATPENVGVIWYAPNHIRAFPRWAYEKVGGYDESFDILDDQDLMTRLYLVGPFVHIDEMLYLQRMHDDNTQFDATRNAKIQRLTVKLYQERIDGLTNAYIDRLLEARNKQ